MVVIPSCSHTLGDQALEGGDNGPCWQPADQLSEFLRLGEEDFSRLAGGISSGSPLDPVPHKIWKEYEGELFPTLRLICNKSLASGVVPACWKRALVSPLLKKPSLDTECSKNYRPISLLPFPAKIVERRVSVALSKHLEQYQQLEELQIGFRPAHGAETALVTAMDELQSVQTEGKESEGTCGVQTDRYRRKQDQGQDKGQDKGHGQQQGQGITPGKEKDYGAGQGHGQEHGKQRVEGTCHGVAQGSGQGKGERYDQGKDQGYGHGEDQGKDQGYGCGKDLGKDQGKDQGYGQGKAEDKHLGGGLGQEHWQGCGEKLGKGQAEDKGKGQEHGKEDKSLEEGQGQGHEGRCRGKDMGQKQGK
ncbi:uncharacterized protein LOC144783164 [Lissotriton helveticus]